MCRELRIVQTDWGIGHVRGNNRKAAGEVIIYRMGSEHLEFSEGFKQGVE